jgi:cell shape-determining protein MreC
MKHIKSFHFRPQPRKVDSPFYAVFLVVALIISLVLALDVFSAGGVRSYIRAGAGHVFAASAGTFSLVSDQGIFTTHRALVAEINSLKEQLSLRDEESARFRAIEEENRSLRSLAHLAGSEGTGISARVLSSFHASPYGTFTIGAGESDGVREGSIVLTPGGLLLGVVTHADQETATVEAIFAPGKMTDLLVQGVALSAEGRGGGNARADVSRDALIVVGDSLTAPAFGGRVAGLVGHIEVASSSATQALSIRLPVNLDTLSFVYVVSSH